MPSRILAIDPGFGRAGVAVLEMKDGKEKLLFSDCISTSAKEEKSERLLQISSQLKKIIEKWQPSALAIETLFFNQNVSSAIGVAEARGMVLNLAAEKGLTAHEYAPQQVKVALTGYGKATKEQVALMVKRIIGLDNAKRLDDELDAIAVGITHLASKKDF